MNKYLREIKPGVFVDVYDVLLGFKVADPMLQHIIKKALAAGQRGHKDFEQDIKDIYDSAKRAFETHCIKVQTVTIDESESVKKHQIFADEIRRQKALWEKQQPDPNILKPISWLFDEKEKL